MIIKLNFEEDKYKMKLKIQELAKIKEADIYINNLTILVGKNSTNKSYVAHLIYMINKILSSYGNYNSSKSTRKLFIEYINYKDNKKMIDIIKNVPSHTSIDETKFELDDDEFLVDEQRIVTFDFSDFDIDIDILLENMKEFIFSEIISRLNLSFNVDRNVLKNVFFMEDQITSKEILLEQKITIKSKDEGKDFLIVLEKIFSEIISKIKKQKISDEEFYFPASRTGFVLTFDEIVSGVLRDRFGGQPTATKLTEPTIDFISGFSDIKSGKFGSDPFDFLVLEDFNASERDINKIEKLFNFVEERIIKGMLIEERKSDKYTQFYLKPSNATEKLELHLTSSATVEMLPIVMFLKHFNLISNKLLVIEEPEAHLHPKAQIEMARFIAMLVNSGAKVIITTHSDYIINEISNCIKVSSLDQKHRRLYLKKHDLEQNMIIEKEKVSAYLFKDTGMHTEIIELEINKYGISNENFDDILDELLERTQEINEYIIG